MGTDNWKLTSHPDVKVDVSSLRRFAKQLHDVVATDFDTNYRVGIKPMLQVAGPFGGGGLAEGQYFRQLHDREKAAAMQLLGDAQVSIAAIIAAISAIAIEYASGDAMASATVDDVFNAFYPGPGMKSLVPQDDGSSPSTPASTDPADDPYAGLPPEERWRLSAYPTDPATGQLPDPDKDTTIAPGTDGAYKILGDGDKLDQTPDDPIVD